MTYFVQTIIRPQYKNGIKMAIFAKSEKDAGFGIRTRASKSVVKRNPIVPTDVVEVGVHYTVFIHDRDKGYSRDN